MRHPVPNKVGAKPGTSEVDQTQQCPFSNDQVTIPLSTNRINFDSTITTMSPQSFAVHSIDHVVLTVASIQATVAFYTKHLGMTHETFVSSDGVER